MNTSIVRLGIAGVLIVSVGTVGVVLLRQRQAELRQMEKSVGEEWVTNHRQRQQLRAVQAKATPAVPAVVAPAAPATTKPAPPASNLARGSRLADALRISPEYAPFERRSLRRLNLRNFGELLAELKLAPAREEALKEILDERLSAGMNAIKRAYQEGHSQGSPEHSKFQQQVNDAAKAKIAALLSDEEEAVYSRYEKSATWRRVHQPELDEFVADRGLPPLTPVQKQALAAAACEARNWKPDPAGGKLTNVALERRRNEEMAKLAAAALDPIQRAVLSDYLEFNHARGEISGRLFYPEKPAGSVFVSWSHHRP